MNRRKRALVAAAVAAAVSGLAVHQIQIGQLREEIREARTEARDAAQDTASQMRGVVVSLASMNTEIEDLDRRLQAVAGYSLGTTSIEDLERELDALATEVSQMKSCVNRNWSALESSSSFGPYLFNC